MNSEEQELEALVRAACGEELPSGWVIDQAERAAEVAEWRELAEELRQALEPPPISPALRERLNRAIARTRPAGSRRLLVASVGLAAAAGLLLAVALPMQRGRPGAGQVPALSSAEARVLVAVFSHLAWTGQVDYGIERLTEQLEQFERELEGRRSDRFPWGPEDEWDLPSGDPTGGLVPRVCLVLSASVGRMAL